ncbi:MAG: hypothetical protein P8Y63_04030 [Deltaproteobacteria bacterium]|jgi:hypothetical protein
MNKKSFMIAAGLFGLACTFGTATAIADTASSSACINCHTDLGRMDEYGAKAAGGAAAIAG